MAARINFSLVLGQHYHERSVYFFLLLETLVFKPVQSELRTTLTYELRLLSYEYADYAAFFMTAKRSKVLDAPD